MPGILTDWPWTPLGNFKYLVLAPWVIHYTYSYMVKEEGEKSFAMLLIFPFLLARMLHSQIWISLSRYRTAKGNNRIVDKSIEFDQVDRERNWDDNIIFNGLIYYVVGWLKEDLTINLPLWRTDGIVITILLHAGPVEFLYYWLHRALHHHFLYSRYHSHHHSSIVTEPITSVVHPFGEHISYFLLFAIPQAITFFTGTASIVSFVGYITYVDFMNYLGHCNFEFVPNTLFTLFPPLKYLLYTPSFHSLHHTQFRTNYSLFMPFYDYVYDTVDKSTDRLYETSLHREEDSPDVVHLTHLTTVESIYHLRLGFPSLASRPAQVSQWYLWLMWPVTLWSLLVTRIYGSTFVLERNIFKNLKLQTWAVPKFSIQYLMKWQKESINALIEEAILKADENGVKVISLGLLNQEEELNENGELYIRRYPNLKIKMVDGSSLVVAIVLNFIPKGTTQVVFTGSLSSKVAYSIALSLCQTGTQVFTLHENEYKKLKARIDNSEEAAAGSNLFMSKCNFQKIWIVGEGFGEEDQMKAAKGTTFIPFTSYPPKKLRKDCFYYSTPAMVTPKYLENVDSCENWLPRRVMSAPRIAGILHALENWNLNECGNRMFDVEKIWEASLHHGFRPLNQNPTQSN